MKEFETKEALFAHLKANKATLIAEKKATIKQADAVSSVGQSLEFYHGDTTDKAEAIVSTDPTGPIKVTSVINTTNILDSHGDVHLPGLWKKSLAEAKRHYLIKEHRFNFDNVISDNVTATARAMKWAALGFPWEGSTQALVFESEITPSDPTGMYDRYKSGKVHEHSVGMRYIKLDLAVNTEMQGYDEEKAVWDKYIDQIANKEAAMDRGYFWAVTEAQIIEGSAVLRGSNYATPTISVKNDSEPDTSTREIEPADEPLKDESLFTRLAKHIN
jgi:hypothetical protein